MTRRIAPLVLASFLAAASALAAPPQTLNYQGRVRLLGGGAVPDSVTNTVDVRICSDDACTGVLWNDTFTGVTTTAGLFNLVIGSGATLNLNFDQPYWLQTRFNGDTWMTPASPLTAAPYAFRARSFELPQDRSVNMGSTVFKLDNSGTGNVLEGHSSNGGAVGVFAKNTASSGRAFYSEGSAYFAPNGFASSVTFATHVHFSGITTGLPGVGAPLSLTLASAAASPLSVSNTLGTAVKAVGVTGVAGDGSTTGLVGSGFNTISGSNAYGVQGFADRSVNGTGIAYGLYGEGYAAATRQGIGVFARGVGGSLPTGVQAMATGTGGRGVYAYVNEASAFGVWGEAPSATGKGVAALGGLVGLSATSTAGWAGWFEGLSGVVISSDALSLSVTTKASNGMALRVRSNGAGGGSTFQNDGGGSAIMAYSNGGNAIFAQSTGVHGVSGLSFGSGMAGLLGSAGGASSIGVRAENLNNGTALYVTGGARLFGPTTFTGQVDFSGASVSGLSLLVPSPLFLTHSAGATVYAASTGAAATSVGIFGRADSAIGVMGVNTPFPIYPNEQVGVYGYNGSGYVGVRGTAMGGALGRGVVAESTGTGLSATSSGAIGIAVLGQSNSASPTARFINAGGGGAVHALSPVSYAAAVLGVSTDTTPPSSGGFTGRGIEGQGPIGVLGGTTVANGVGVASIVNTTNSPSLYAQNTGAGAALEGESDGGEALRAVGFTRGGEFSVKGAGGTGVYIHQSVGAKALEVWGNSTFGNGFNFSSVSFNSHVDFSGATVTGLAGGVSAPLSLTSTSTAATVFAANTGGGLALAARAFNMAVSATATSAGGYAFYGGASTSASTAFFNNDGIGSGVTGQSYNGPGVEGISAGAGPGVRAHQTGGGLGPALLAQGGYTAVSITTNFGAGSRAIWASSNGAGTPAAEFINYGGGAPLKVNNLSFPSGAGSNGQVLTTDGGAQMSWAFPPGVTAPLSLTGSGEAVIHAYQSGSGPAINARSFTGTGGQFAGDGMGVSVTASGPNATGLMAWTNSVNYSLYGRNDTVSTTGGGVLGQTSNGYGVYGYGLGGSSIGVFGEGSMAGVSGRATAGPGGWFSGVTGVVSRGTHTGLVAQGTGFGISASATTAGTGISIYATGNSTANGQGVVMIRNTGVGTNGSGLFSQAGSQGHGIHGSTIGSPPAGGYASGVYGSNNGATGVGVLARNPSGVALAAGGGAVGLSGSATDGAGVHAQGVTGVVALGSVIGLSAAASTGGTGVYARGDISLDAQGLIRFRGQNGGTPSAGGEGRIYFDDTLGRFQVSEDGGAWADLVPIPGVYVSKAGDSMSGPLDISGGGRGLSATASSGTAGLFFSPAASGVGLKVDASGSGATGMDVRAEGSGGWGAIIAGNGLGLSVTASGGRAVFASSNTSTYGIQSDNYGSGPALAGFNASSGGTGVYGQLSAPANTGVAVYGANTGTNNTGKGVYGVNNQSNGVGVWGQNTAGKAMVAEGNTVGLSATANNTSGPAVGVHGEAFGTSSQKYGVVGRVNGSGLQTIPGGVGVLGENGDGTGYGVLARNFGGGGIALVAAANAQAISATTISGTLPAIFAAGTSSDGIVRGDNDGGGPGVFGYGRGAGYGVLGQVTAGTTGAGVVGLSAANGVTGVFGSAGTTGGYGMQARNSAASGAAVALSASSASASGVAIRAEVSSTAQTILAVNEGFGAAVRGESASTGGSGGVSGLGTASGTYAVGVRGGTSFIINGGVGVLGHTGQPGVGPPPVSVGVYGFNNVASGFAIYGYAQGTNAHGVYSVSTGTGGTAGYFLGDSTGISVTTTSSTATGISVTVNSLGTAGVTRAALVAVNSSISGTNPGPVAVYAISNLGTFGTALLGRGGSGGNGVLGVINGASATVDGRAGVRALNTATSTSVNLAPALDIDGALVMNTARSDASAGSANVAIGTAAAGNAQINYGTLVVNTPVVRANSIILLTVKDTLANYAASTQLSAIVSAQGAGTFTIRASAQNFTNVSPGLFNVTVDWLVINQR